MNDSGAAAGARRDQRCSRIVPWHVHRDRATGPGAKNRGRGVATRFTSSSTAFPRGTSPRGDPSGREADMLKHAAAVLLVTVVASRCRGPAKTKTATLRTAPPPVHATVIVLGAVRRPRRPPPRRPSATNPQQPPSTTPPGGGKQTSRGGFRFEPVGPPRGDAPSTSRQSRTQARSIRGSRM